MSHPNAPKPEWRTSVYNDWSRMSDEELRKRRTLQNQWDDLVEQAQALTQSVAADLEKFFIAMKSCSSSLSMERADAHVDVKTSVVPKQLIPAGLPILQIRL